MQQTTRKTMRHNFKKSQQGIVLVVALIFLLIMTVLGIAGISASFMEEKMVGNSISRENAFQAAEAALRAGERYLAVSTNKATIIEAICGTAADAEDDCNRAFTSNGTDNKDDGDDLGDDCTNGFCTPREQDWEYDNNAANDCSDANYIPERWESCPTGSAAAGNNMNLFNNAGFYQTYPTAGQLGSISQEPRYIIEFLGFRIPEGELSACDTDSDGFNDTPPDSAFWPFCENDLAHFRVTAMGYGGTRNTKVMLQSTLVVDN